MKRRKMCGMLLLVCMLLFCLHATAAKAASAKESIRLSQSTISLRVGRAVTLRASVTPSRASKKVAWKSSNPKVVRVNSSGKIRGVEPGSAKITASTAGGKKASCTVRVTRTGKKYVADTKAGKQTYYIYNQVGNNRYISGQGCVLTAVAIAASHFGKDYTPEEIHAAPASVTYGERYAVQKLGGSLSLYGHAAISVATASQILKDMGIENKAVYKYDKKEAIQEIKRHALEGKPVLIKVNSKTHNGVRIATAHHMLVLAGIDSKGYGIFIEPFGGRINYAHFNGKYYRMTVTETVTYHMDPAVGNYRGPYVTSIAAAGGYILVG